MGTRGTGLCRNSNAFADENGSGCLSTSSAPRRVVTAYPSAIAIRGATWVARHAWSRESPIGRASVSICGIASAVVIVPHRRAGVSCVTLLKSNSQSKIWQGSSASRWHGGRGVVTAATRIGQCLAYELSELALDAADVRDVQRRGRVKRGAWSVRLIAVRGGNPDTYEADAPQAGFAHRVADVARRLGALVAVVVGVPVRDQDDHPLHSLGLTFQDGSAMPNGAADAREARRTQVPDSLDGQR